MNSIGFDLKNARFVYSFFIHFINIENSCDFKQHAINDFNKIIQIQIMGSEKKTSFEVNRMKLEAKKKLKENDGRRKEARKKFRIFLL